MVATRINFRGPLRPDGKPSITRCRPGCHKPKNSECHCTVCHDSFSSADPFDLHRRDGYCLNPASVQLVLVDGIWSTPEGHERRAKDAERMRLARESRGKGKASEAP